MELVELMKKRFSARKYEDKPIPKEVEDYLIQALKWAPSGKNTQPWKFIFIKDNEIKERLKKACKGQKYVLEAPLVVAAIGFPEDSYPAMGGYWNAITVDVSIALTQMMLAAKEKELDTCWIGAFYEKDVKEILEVPENGMVVSLMTVGYSSQERKTGRKDESEIICYEKYS